MDWVVLIAAAIMLALFGYGSISNVVADFVQLLNDLMSNANVTT